MSTVGEFTLYATAPKGLEYLLVDELRELGAVTANEKLAGVEFTGDMALIYKACLWSRLANRILLKLTSFPANTPEALYRGVQTIAWEKHLHPDGTLAVTVNSANSEISHTMFAAQKVKDAIVDQFRAKFNRRPDVAREKPDLHINVYINRNEATVSLDLSGESLHRRGYRLNTGAAPLKENLAAAILIRAKWPAIAKAGGALFDPMCGSGTLLVEAAMMAADIAPGLNRQHFGFLGWEQHKPATWEKYLNTAKSRAEKGMALLPEITGYDIDASAVAIAFENIERSGLSGKIHVEKRELVDFAPNSESKPGLVVTNPPYGERLGEEDELQPLYTCLGDRLKAAFPGWSAAVFTGNPDLGKVMGIRAKKFYALFNGTIPCKLLLFDISPEKFIDRSIPANRKEF
jgi:23S rRNA (guanine2445-N2)-methyltransferase / 23S rRNA (guanine2069-N7)-methyltransferase